MRKILQQLNETDIEHFITSGTENLTGNYGSTNSPGMEIKSLRLACKRIIRENYRKKISVRYQGLNKRRYWATM